MTADRTRVKQIFVNLLSNAIKYNRVGGRVEVRCRAAPGDRVRVSFQDTGEGLSADKLAQLFQPFNRLGQEAGVEEGTGIGLVVCKQLVELMGGEIGVDSTVGVGSVFWIELHAANGVDAPAEAGRCDRRCRSDDARLAASARCAPCCASRTTRPTCCWSRGCWRAARTSGCSARRTAGVASRWRARPCPTSS